MINLFQKKEKFKLKIVWKVIKISEEILILFQIRKMTKNINLTKYF